MRRPAPTTGQNAVRKNYTPTDKIQASVRVKAAIDWKICNGARRGESQPPRRTDILVVLFPPRGQSARMKSFPTVRSLRIAVLLFAATLSSVSAQSDETAITLTHKIELFAGKSFSGWTFVSKDTNAPAAAIWSVTNGVIDRKST